MNKIIFAILLISQSMIGMELNPSNLYMIEKQNRVEMVKQEVAQLKKAIYDKADSTSVQTLINNIQKYFLKAMGHTPGIREMWKDIAPQKASLVGNAESAARIVDLQVQQLVKRNQPVPQLLQDQHANARTNIHLIKDFLYSLEKEMEQQQRGRTSGLFAIWDQNLN